jgi:N-acetylglucosaminylphosphatidylinositol deacetylase
MTILLIFGIFNIWFTIPLTLWYFIRKNQTKPILVDKNILIITAHPDDECMFFSPTILNLTLCNNVKLLCLSKGNAEGLGSKRSDELLASCKQLNIAHVDIIDNEFLPDSMSVEWDSDQIITVLNNYLKKNNVELIISFDGYGISGYSNHISIYKALKYGVEHGIVSQAILK